MKAAYFVLKPDGTERIIRVSGRPQWARLQVRRAVDHRQLDPDPHQDQDHDRPTQLRLVLEGAS